MKIKLVNIIEIIVGVLFIGGHFLRNAGIPYMALVTVLGGFILSIMYFNLGFITLRSPETAIGNLIAYGAVFGISIIALMFYFLHWPFSLLYIIVGSSLLTALALIRIIAVYLFKQPQILAYNTAIVIRYCILFALLPLCFFHVIN